MDEDKAKAKVLFRVEGEDGETNVETLWAESLGKDRYRLANSPFFAYSVSWRDIVLAPVDPAERLPTYRRVVEKSGNRTIRVILYPPAENGNKSERKLKTLARHGCGYEGADGSYVAINIPPEVDLDRIRSLLTGWGFQWEHADPTYEELFPSED